jgi:oxygen-independent coproporphyrinogen-3 oxidase
MLMQDELNRRMSRPQRHRLLQGYPMAPLMSPAPPERDPFRGLELDPSRPLLIGVLPHTFCNPKVKGCGFCTFPHEKFGRDAMKRVVARVAEEIARTPVRGRSASAIYIGGGTANLTPPDDLERLCVLLASTFDVHDAELTLEGVPAYFLIRDEALLDVLARASVRHRRISMGVQTFDDEWLKRMGRDAFGNRNTFERVVAAAHRRGFTASADLLFNLPGTTVEHSLADIRAAIECQFDQICIYNLVLTEDLDTEWARDRRLVSLMPRGAQSKETWHRLRAELLAHGYVQTTLTNFERSDRRFEYERASFDPGTYDGIGFGPGAISTFTDRAKDRATKWINRGSSEAYAATALRAESVIGSIFDYETEDLKLLHITRNLSRLSIDTAGYERFFRTAFEVDFAEPLGALAAAGLVRAGDASIELTEEGMFYADAVAGLLSHRRVAALRRNFDDRSNVRQFMG